jgi:hypothetical protein
MLARQVLYQLAYISSPLAFFFEVCFSGRLLCFLLELAPDLDPPILHPPK